MGERERSSNGDGVVVETLEGCETLLARVPRRPVTLLCLGGPRKRENVLSILSHTHTLSLSLPLFATPSASLSAGLDGMACLCFGGRGPVYYMCTR